MTNNLGGVARNAAKWSLLTEVFAKIITPLTQLVLARILAPEAFGVLAIVIMVASFAEMLADAGFQKYLVQHEFEDQASLYRAANVAFWSSMTIAIALLAAVVLARDEIAELVGTPHLGLPIAVAALSIPFSVFVSTQQALFRRAFEYKKVLPVRVIFAVIPLLVSVPLALIGFGYWSLIIGVLIATLFHAIGMTVISPWKPGLYFSFPLLKRMFSFSSWSLLESLSIWATLWAGTFIVGNILTPHELGLYRQPMLVVNSAFAVITAATTPILFAALSRFQSDPEELRRFFLKFQFPIAVVLLPIGIGAFFYREFFTELMFGPQWAEAALMLGAWSLSTSFAIIYSHYCSEVFRSLGRPRISFLSQCLYMAVMIPVLYFAAQQGFTTLVIANAAVRVIHIVINQTLLRIIAGFGVVQVTKNLYQPLLASIVMGALAAWLADVAGGHWGWSLLGILICGMVYALVCLSFPRTRDLIVTTLARAKPRSKLDE